MEVPRHWRLKKQRYALVGETCPVCKAHLFPPRAVCPYCSEEARSLPAIVEQAPVLVLEGHAQAVEG